MNWKILTCIVCAFGFFKDLRPSEAYLTRYLTGSWKNLTVDQVDNEVYPWWTYSYLLWLIPVFLLTDYLRYKPMLILDGLAYIGTWALLLWAQGVPAMKLMQVVYGLATAGEIGYYSYLYAQVSKNHYTKIASFTRGASLIGKFVAYLTGQLLISFQLVNYFHLNIISFVSVCIAFLIAIILPRAKYSEIFHQYTELKDDDVNPTGSDPNNAQPRQLQTRSNGEFRYKLVAGVIFLASELKNMYSCKTIVLWSVWWALASCGNFQVGNYIQNLWTVIAPHKESRKIYNGAVEAAATLLGAAMVTLVGFISVDWAKQGRGEVMMSVVCAFNAVLLIIMAKTTEIWVAYVFYVLFRTTYQTVITIATAQIAGAMSRQRYGFVFGCNMFLALLIETILTAVVVDKAGLGVDVVTQFIIYGSYFAVIALVFLVAAMVTILKEGCWCSQQPVEASNQGNDLNSETEGYQSGIAPAVNTVD